MKSSVKCICDKFGYLENGVKVSIFGFWYGSFFCVLIRISCLFCMFLRPLNVIFDEYCKARQDKTLHKANIQKIILFVNFFQFLSIFCFNSSWKKEIWVLADSSYTLLVSMFMLKGINCEEEAFCTFFEMLFIHIQKRWFFWMKSYVLKYCSGCWVWQFVIILRYC